MKGRRDETQPSMQFVSQHHLSGIQRSGNPAYPSCRNTVYRDSGLALANYPAYPTATPIYRATNPNSTPRDTGCVQKSNLREGRYDALEGLVG